MSQSGRVSDHYKLGLTQPSLEFVDVRLTVDTPLFMDPRAFRGLRSDWGDECHHLVRAFFGEVLDAIRADDEPRAMALLAGLHEPNETRLGLSQGTVAGRGVGEGLAADLYEALSGSRAVRTSGLIEDLEETALVIPGIGVDLVSDITTNVVRQKLIEFTHEMVAKYSIPMVDDVDPGPVWSPKDGWVSSPTALPVPANAGGPLLLVPRTVVRWRVDYDPGEYYQHYVLRALQDQELSKANSSLVTVLKSGPKKGQRRVTKKDVAAQAKRQVAEGGAKAVSVKTTLENPSVLDEFRAEKNRSQKPPESLQFLAEKIGTPEPDWDALLKDVTDCSPGKTDAYKYEKAVEALLTPLFDPNLVAPKSQKVTANGTQRIDISYRNMATGGFFKWFTTNHAPAPWVAVECKNYKSELGNNEVYQIGARLNAFKGMLGLLVYRSVKDRAGLMTRCRQDLIGGSGKYILAVDDGILSALVAARKSDDAKAFTGILADLVEELID